MYLRNNAPDAGSVLAELAASIRGHSDEVDLYLDHIGEYEVYNPFLRDAPAVGKTAAGPIPYSLWERLGIRHVISNTDPGGAYPGGPIEGEGSGGAAPEGQWHLENGKNDRTPAGWQEVKKDAIIEGLRTVISGSPIIQFAEWAKVEDASRFWDGLFSDVIKPLNKRDFEFIFHLGDITKRLAFEVDEVLDIIGDYTSYGRVTLVLDDAEADKLWSRLNGEGQGGNISRDKPQDAREKCLSLFNIMNVDVLLVLYGDHAVIFSRDWQFDLAGMALNDMPTPAYAKDCFNTGFRLGLLLRLDMPHCVALGLAVMGTYMVNAAAPDSKGTAMEHASGPDSKGAAMEHACAPDAKALVAYINDWIAALRPAVY